MSGQVLLAQGDEHNGRLRLSKALKLAHNRLSNHSLVSQVAPRLTSSIVQAVACNIYQGVL